MNGELEIYSVVRRKKQGYTKGSAHRTFDNLLSQDFTADDINQNC